MPETQPSDPNSEPASPSFSDDSQKPAWLKHQESKRESLARRLVSEAMSEEQVRAYLEENYMHPTEIDLVLQLMTSMRTQPEQS